MRWYSRSRTGCTVYSRCVGVCVGVAEWQRAWVPTVELRALAPPLLLICPRLFPGHRTSPTDYSTSPTGPTRPPRSSRALRNKHKLDRRSKGRHSTLPPPGIQLPLSRWSRRRRCLDARKHGDGDGATRLAAGLCATNLKFFSPDIKHPPIWTLSAFRIPHRRTRGVLTLPFISALLTSLPDIGIQRSGHRGTLAVPCCGTCPNDSVVAFPLCCGSSSSLPGGTSHVGREVLNSRRR